MTEEEKELIEDHERNAQSFKNLCHLLFIVGALIATTLLLIYINF